jgi:ferrochelatase
VPRVGILVVGFGGPDCPDAVGPFMCNLMGREPAPEVVARVRSRYELIGGCSPLAATAAELAELIAAAVARRGVDAVATVGMRYWEPYIGGAVEDLVRAGATQLVIVALSPFETHVTHGEYRDAVAEALEGHPDVASLEAPLLSELPVYATLHAEAARAALARLGQADAPVVFSAHSLPRADVLADDAYVSGLEACAERVAAELGLAAGGPDAEVFPGIVGHGAKDGPRRWIVAYQSKGVRGGEWLGPDTDDAIGAAATIGARGIAVVPLGFATEHMETLYDLDIVAARRAAAAGISFERSAAPDADPRLADAVAAAIVDILA